VKEVEFYKVKTDPYSGYDLDSIELRVIAYAITGVVPEGHRELLLLLLLILLLLFFLTVSPKSCEHRPTFGARSGGRPNSPYDGK
jgi:hypothetical protein